MPPIENSPTNEVKYLSLEQVLTAHTALIKRYGGSQGIRDRGLLESAVFRPQASAFGQEAYPDLFEKCAVLGYSIIQNHPFVDGNKRTGFAAMHLMLLINSYDLTSSSEEEVAMAEDIACRKIHEPEVAIWLKEHSKK
ncbi:MAG: type II toxin-antitoxin system death-on-curing family toxin [Candidatus Omnitrophica bacterium]|nr:type II toxin-antitoxin system death-on-curing family toxin [Candidatus Omnitrophota bacterium]